MNTISGNFYNNVQPIAYKNTNNHPILQHQISQQQSVTFEGVSRPECTNNLLKKTTIWLGSIALLIGGFILGRGKIKSIKAKKQAQILAEQTQKEAKAKAELLKKQAEETAKKQQELLKTQQETKLKAETEKADKLKSQQETKLKDETEKAAKLKTQQEAKIETQKIAQKKLQQETTQQLTTDFNKKFAVGINAKGFFSCTAYKMSTADYANGIVDVLKQAESKGLASENITQIWKNIRQEANLSDEILESVYTSPPIIGAKPGENYTEMLSMMLDRNFQIKHTLLDRRTLIQDLEKLQTQIPQKENEAFSSYIERLIETRKNNVAKQTQKHLADVKSKIKYADDVPYNYNLTNNELEILRKWQPETYSNLSKEEARKALSKHTTAWVHGYTGDNMQTNIPDEISNILIKRCFPRHNSRTSDALKYSSNFGEVQPLARWMKMGSNTQYVKNGNLDEYIENTFKVGEKYTTPRFQSCSKDLTYAESTFNDSCSDLDVKFIIHPKGKTSKAADIGLGQYGANEAIYPEGSEFKILDKRIVEVDEGNGKKFHRWVIEMQEA